LINCELTDLSAADADIIEALHGEHVVDAWVDSDLVHDCDSRFFRTVTHVTPRHANSTTKQDHLMAHLDSASAAIDCQSLSFTLIPQLFYDLPKLIDVRNVSNMQHATATMRE